MRSLDPAQLHELESLTSKVFLYLELHRFEAAEKLIRSTIHNHSSNAQLHNLLGLTFHKQSRFVEAIQEFEAALQINPSFVEAGLNLAATLSDLSRYDEAKKVFADLRSRQDPKRKQSPLVLGRLADQHASSGRLYEGVGMYAEAIQEYRKATSLFEPLVDVKLSLSWLYIRTGQLDRAKIELEGLVSDQPEVADARSLLGLIFYKLGRADQAREHWHKAQKIDPNHASSRAYLRITSTY